MKKCKTKDVGIVDWFMLSLATLGGSILNIFAVVNGIPLPIVIFGQFIFWIATIGVVSKMMERGLK